MDITFFNVLETDLRLLATEAKKSDTIAQLVTAGWLGTSDVPKIKDCTERAVLRLRLLSKEGKDVGSIREATVRLQV
jgi:hypothetical protein